MKTFAAGSVSMALALVTGAALADSDVGRNVFLEQAQPSCAVCHTLEDAGAAGNIGPNLDELKPTREQVVNAVTGGVGIMPAFEESLSEEQIQAVAEYIVRVTQD
ncbi:MAG TPA: cytochrome c [Marinobacter sp.]|jgi:mono/diheme cytochrome c family protein|nr:cytochrome c [Marinobacter sp.]